MLAAAQLEIQSRRETAAQAITPIHPTIAAAPAMMNSKGQCWTIEVRGAPCGRGSPITAGFAAVAENPSGRSDRAARVMMLVVDATNGR